MCIRDRYYFLNDTDPNIDRLNCTFVGYHDTFNAGIYSFECFSQEKILGIIILALMFLPGVLLSILMAYGLRKYPLGMWICIIISPLICATFPVLLFLVNVNSIATYLHNC